MYSGPGRVAEVCRSDGSGVEVTGSAGRSSGTSKSNRGKSLGECESSTVSKGISGPLSEGGPGSVGGDSFILFVEDVVKAVRADCAALLEENGGLRGVWYNAEGG